MEKCTNCNIRIPKIGCRTCEQCLESASKWEKSHKTKRSERRKKYKIEKKKLVIDHYGGQCNCCGLKFSGVLTLDHIVGGNGHKHRKDKNSTGFYHVIITQGFPVGYQILCLNCNTAKGMGEECPINHS